ncbi:MULTISPECIES: helix-turn-helix domain-containing protein [Roseobacteraceae]|uniref:Helix-turn-helix domain protein n=1 Tax=Pseudosulfitobacter pseudonitzschiae TaxID=1402135 RepID=A0A221JZ84_9RHOB|nr:MULTISPECIES: RodZ domain-containing protein [Roseobacteraceae]ASM72052.1 helix-turn-helix domain protein [Pseudosulfitobacter pseudonitzschiae]
MIGRKTPKIIEQNAEPKGFDDFELRLGDVMRGERATLGKSLLDVQRELRIKASYIAAIENTDPSAFDTPGFIAGYVRSYARYLDMDPDRAFSAFCTESGFTVAHGMSAEASVVKKPSREDRLSRDRGNKDIFSAPNTPFVPTGEGFFSRIEPGAIGSSLVLIALISAIGFGGYSVLQEVQRVQVSPVDQTPVVLSDLDPLQGAVVQQPSFDGAEENSPSTLDTPRIDALDRLYRPQALDVPVLVARDAPIATIDPRSVGNFAQTPGLEAPVVVGAEPLKAEVPAVPQVVENEAPVLQMVAVRPSWVRVRGADGTVIYETVMQPGDTWTAPATEEPPVLRTGESGAIYFAMNGKFYGPVGANGAVTSNLPLEIAGLQETYLPVDVSTDSGLVRYAEASATAATVLSD